MKSDLIHPELSYLITGVCFQTHNELGRFCREIQYCNLLEQKFKEYKIEYEREYRIGDSGNILDFLIENKIILEIKARDNIKKEDYYQVQRYLQRLDIKLGLLINFRNRYLKPIRIIKINTDTKNKYR